MRKPGLTLWILLALVTGVVTGLVLGPAAGILGDAGKPVISLIKTIAAPLVFFAIVDAILSAGVDGRGLRRLLAITSINGILALAIGLGLHEFLAPGEALKSLASSITTETASAPPPPMTIDFAKTLENIIPKSIVEPFLNSNIAGIVILALLVGFSLRAHSHTSNQAETSVAKIITINHSLLKAAERCILWVVWLVPLAVFGVSAKAAGERGLSGFVGLGYYVGVVMAGFAMHVGIVYSTWLRFYCQRSIADFWQAARKPVSHAFGCNSSLATLPLTLSALDRLKVSRKSSTLASCVGTNLNNDGIILYEVVTALAVATASGIDLSLGQQIGLAGLCLIAAMGVAGVPEAGFVSLSLVLSTLNLPMGLLPMLLSVDWVLARARSAVNTASDMVCSSVLDCQTPQKN
jgi:Na+/H+-dicarboxylate symporter